MAPLFQVKAHVATFSLLFGIPTALALAYSLKYSQTEDELRSVLTEKYPEIKKGKLEKEKMQAFFNDLQDKSKREEMDKKLNDVLKG